MSDQFDDMRQQLDKDLKPQSEQEAIVLEWLRHYTMAAQDKLPWPESDVNPLIPRVQFSGAAMLTEMTLLGNTRKIIELVLREYRPGWKDA